MYNPKPFFRPFWNITKTLTNQKPPKQKPVIPYLFTHTRPLTKMPYFKFKVLNLVVRIKFI